jgi:hypothetical protein
MGIRSLALVKMGAVLTKVHCALVIIRRTIDLTSFSLNVRTPFACMFVHLFHYFKFSKTILLLSFSVCTFLSFFLKSLACGGDEFLFFDCPFNGRWVWVQVERMYWIIITAGSMVSKRLSISSSFERPAMYNLFLQHSRFTLTAGDTEKNESKVDDLLLNLFILYTKKFLNVTSYVTFMVKPWIDLHLEKYFDTSGQISASSFEKKKKRQK